MDNPEILGDLEERFIHPLPGHEDLPMPGLQPGDPTRTWTYGHRPCGSTRPASPLASGVLGPTPPLTHVLPTRR